MLGSPTLERRKAMKPSIVLAAVAAVLALTTGPAQATQSDIKVSPKEIAFGTRTVGTDYFDGVKITNTSGRTLQVLVEAGLPDDFGFGFMPGSTCPPLTPGELMADGASCRAVVRFTPTEFFVGQQQTGSLTVTTTDPETGAVNVTEIPVSGTGKN
jgi:hypothetical protein